MDNTPADKVFALLGIETVCAACGVTRGQARRWKYPRSRGGSDGVIPQRHHVPILMAAARKGVPLTAADLVPWPAGRAA